MKLDKEGLYIKAIIGVGVQLNPMTTELILHAVQLVDKRGFDITFEDLKEIELEVLKSYNLNIVFEEDAIDFLIEQFINHNATHEEILSKIYDNYYDGFNLMREKTGKNRFFLSKNALIDHETYLNDLIRKEIT